MKNFFISLVIVVSTVTSIALYCISKDLLQGTNFEWFSPVVTFMFFTLCLAQGYKIYVEYYKGK